MESISYDGAVIEPAPKNEDLGYRMMALFEGQGCRGCMGSEASRDVFKGRDSRPEWLSHRASAVVPMSASGIPRAARLELPIKIPVSIGFSPSRTTVVAWFPAMRLLAWNIRQGSGSRPPRIAKALKQRYSKYQPLAWRASAWHYHGISGATLCRERRLSPRSRLRSARPPITVGPPWGEHRRRRRWVPTAYGRELRVRVRRDRLLPPVDGPQHPLQQACAGCFCPPLPIPLFSKVRNNSE